MHMSLYQMTLLIWCKLAYFQVQLNNHNNRWQQAPEAYIIIALLFFKYMSAAFLNISLASPNYNRDNDHQTRQSKVSLLRLEPKTFTKVLRFTDIDTSQSAICRNIYVLIIMFFHRRLTWNSAKLLCFMQALTL